MKEVKTSLYNSVEIADDKAKYDENVKNILANKIIGAIIILSANFSLAYNKGKFRINKYFIMAFCSNFLFAVAMLINVGLSNNFNLAFYTFVTVMGPALLISIFSRLSPKKLIDEFNLYDKKYFLIAAFSWCLMLNSSIRAYQLGSVIVVASLFSLTAILNALMELILLFAICFLCSIPNHTR